MWPFVASKSGPRRRVQCNPFWEGVVVWWRRPACVLVARSRAHSVFRMLVDAPVTSRRGRRWCGVTPLLQLVDDIVTFVPALHRACSSSVRFVCRCSSSHHSHPSSQPLRLCCVASRGLSLSQSAKTSNTPRSRSLSGCGVFSHVRPVFFFWSFACVLGV